MTSVEDMDLSGRLMQIVRDDADEAILADNYVTLVEAASSLKALQAERVSLIDTKREQLARLTAERDAAEALAQTYAEALGRIKDGYGPNHTSRFAHYVSETALQPPEPSQ